MVRTADEIMSLVKARIGEDTSDEAIGFLEDISDTLKDFEERIAEDWKAKFEANDAEWRRRYSERFFEGGEPRTEETAFVEGEVAREGEETENNITLDDLLS